MSSYWHRAAAESQTQCNAIDDDFRAGMPTPLARHAPFVPPASIDTSDQLQLRLAEELEYVRRMLQAMGNELSADGAVIVRHPRALQSVDIIGQILGHVAAVVRSSDPPGAVGRIGMTELKARLTRRSIR